jgi:hypothetical protein
MASFLPSSKLEKLNHDNYRVWKVTMESTLDLPDMWPAIEGEVATAIEDAILEEDLDGVDAAVRRVDRRARSLLLLHLDYSLLSLVEGEVSARRVWLALEAYFLDRLLAKQVLTEEKFFTIKQGGSETVQQYMDRGTVLYKELLKVGSEISEGQAVRRMYSGARPSLRVYATSVLDRVETTLAELHSRLQSAESLLGEVGVPSDSAQAHAVDGFARNQQFRGKCYKCKRKGHKASECTAQPDHLVANAAVLSCTFCEEDGHVRSSCPELANFERLAPGTRHLGPPDRGVAFVATALDQLD